MTSVITTTQLFIQQAILVHGDLYDYSNSKFTKMDNKLSITCSIHGNFDQAARSHIKGYGCQKCGVIKREQTMMDRYGVSSYTLSPAFKKQCEETNMLNHGVALSIDIPGVRERQKQTRIEKYGVEYPLQNSTIHNKTIATLQETYGSSTVGNIESIRNKIAATNQLRFNSNSPFGSLAVQNKSKQTSLTRYGKENPNQLEPATLQQLNDKSWLLESNKTMSMISIAKLLGISDSTVGNYFKKHHIIPKVHNCSGGETELASELASELAKYVDVVQSDRMLIAPFELDIVIPTHKLAIEYCGLYWHGEVHKKSSYHRDKLRLCEGVGYRLITIYEDEWVENQQLVFQKILHILKMDRSKKIPARKCYIGVVAPKQKSRFHNSHHIQGSSKATISYGLYNGPELVAVVSMVQRAALWELVRYSTSCQVVGGFSKLMKHFVSNHQPHQVVTFADLRWSVGELYSATGWTLDRTIPPDYYWYKGTQRKHKFNFRHAVIKHKFPNYDSSATEVVNCHSHGWKRIYDCGKHRYVLSSEKV